MFKKITVLLILFVMVTIPAFSKGIEVQKDGVGIYIFKIPLDEYGGKIKPYVADELSYASDIFNNEELNLQLVVNGGFFNVKTGDGISSVIIDCKEKESLFDNLPLLSALHKQGRVEKVLNRCEFRILENKNGALAFDIQNHFTPIPDGYKIKHGLQAGPMILPELQLEEESFIKYKNNKPVNLAADVLKRRERTILGLKKGLLNKEYLYIIIFTKENKAALNEVRDYCLELDLDKAMALDGGASTSINYKNIEIFSANDSQRKVKSFLTIEN